VQVSYRLAQDRVHELNIMLAGHHYCGRPLSRSQFIAGLIESYYAVWVARREARKLVGEALGVEPPVRRTQPRRRADSKLTAGGQSVP
jgi:hypothetical protein